MKRQQALHARVVRPDQNATIRGCPIVRFGDELQEAARQNHHLQSIYQKFGVDSRAAAVAVAAGKGLLEM